MTEENADIPLAVEVSGDEGNGHDASFDIPVIAVAEISKPEDTIDESTDVPLALKVNGDEGSQNEIFDIPSTMEVNEPEIRNAEVIVDIINTPKIRPRIFSRYRSPRAGSCHDFCKYGINYSLEAMPANPVSRKRNSVGSDGRDLRRIMVSLAKQNKDPTSSMSSRYYNAINVTGLKEDAISSPKIVTSSTKRLLPSIKEDQAAAVHYNRTKLNLSLSKQNGDAINSKSSRDYNTISITDLKEDVTSSPKIVTSSPERLLASIKGVQAAGTKLNLSLSNGSSFAGQGSSQTKRNKEVRKGKKKDGGGSSTSRTNTSRRQRINLSAKEDMQAVVPQTVTWIPRNRVKRVAKVDKKVNGRYSLKNQIRPTKMKPDPTNSEVVEERTIYMIEPSSKNEKEESAQISVHTTELSCQESLTATDNSLKHGQEVDGTSIVSPLSAKKNMRHTRNGNSSKILSTSPTVSSGFKGRLRHKRLGLIQISETRSAPSSPLSSRFPNEPIHGEHGGRTTRTSGQDVSRTSGQDVKKGEESKVEHKIKTRSRRMALSDSENVDSQSRKLKFRKGRMVELQTEAITPRRLKFRPVRLLGETQSPKSDSRKRIFQRKEANQNDEVKEAQNRCLRQHDQEIKKKKSFRWKETMDGKLVSSRIKSERIVLKHQDSKGKKNIQNLFNNVIEETASKLAQTRKSKVKALVGAFETVISLQDTRPTGTVVA